VQHKKRLMRKDYIFACLLPPVSLCFTCAGILKQPAVQHKKRLMRKDYQGDGKRDNTWNEKKTHRADQFLEAGDMHNEAFEEYYKVQVC
jgi:hypothetical protein